MRTKGLEPRRGAGRTGELDRSGDRPGRDGGPRISGYREGCERSGLRPALVEQRQADPGHARGTYLAETRGVDLDALPDNVDNSLRFHRHCVFGPGIAHPCLLALMRDPAGDAPIGIQRIALTPDARKIDRMMLGKAGVVKLWPAGKQLVLGEGLETVLAAATRLPYRDEPLTPAWAALSDGGMKKFPLIDGVERLILLADNDANRAGQIAAEACKRRWLEANRRVALLTPDPRPDHSKTDFNDIVLANREAAS